MARSNPKTRTGGRRTAGANPFNQNPPVPPTQTQQPPVDDDDDLKIDDNGIDIDDDGNGEESNGLAAFRAMTDDEKADFISQALKQKPPSFLPDNDSQRFLYALGGDDHPTVVTDSQLDAMKGYDLYRQVAGAKTQFGDISSGDIVNQIMLGDHTLLSNSGGSAYGRALYFTDSYNGIRGYGTSNTNYVKGGGYDSTMIRTKISPNAKGITYSTLKNNIMNEIHSGSKLGKVLQRVNSTDRDCIYAIAKGIDYSYDNTYSKVGSDRYHMIYNRGCLVASSKTKHNAFNDRTW